MLDVFRTEYLQAENLTVLRFTNLEVDKNFKTVCEQIDFAVQNNLSLSY